MKKRFSVLIALVIIFSSFSAFFNSTDVQASSNTKLIDDYVTINSVSKKDETITIKYTIKKNIPAGYKYTFQTNWAVYSSNTFDKTVKLNSKKGTYTAKINKTGSLVGPQSVSVKVNVASRYSQIKKIATYYKLPPNKVVEHVMSKKEAAANHYAIVAGLATIKIAKGLTKSNPIGITLNLGFYGLSSVYTLKSINVISSGYPTPVAGQYSRVSTSYEKDKIIINIKIWNNKESYKKGVKPIYNKTQTNVW